MSKINKFSPIQEVGNMIHKIQGKNNKHLNMDKLPEMINKIPLQITYHITHPVFTNNSGVYTKVS